MKPTKRPQPRFGRFGRFGRSRFRYDHEWWGEPSPVDRESTRYWATTRRPFPCLLFVLPLLLFYEAGLLALGESRGGALRAGADTWLRHGLALLGLTDRWLLPLLLTSWLLLWQAVDRRDWRFHPLVVGGMLAESLGLAVVLMGLSKLVDVGFDKLDGVAALSVATPAGWEPLLGCVGAGVYEEALFRLALIPLIYRVLRLLTLPGLPASILAITLSSVLFSLAHHAGAPGEPFSLFAFVFRWLAGVFFAYIFVVRGFGVAVGTHSAYDLLVGWCEVHP